jgi:hypothetical protein
MKYHTPRNLRAPFARYSHGVEVPAGASIDVLLRAIVDRA